MPTYTLWSEPNAIPAVARPRLASVLTEIHHEVAVAPRYLVQVVFVDLASQALYLAGHPAPDGHVWIRADIRAGRTETVKRTLLHRIAAEVGATLDISTEQVWVYINDIPGANIAEYGQVLPPPGQEDEWFANLPAATQDRLRNSK